VALEEEVNIIVIMNSSPVFSSGVVAFPFLQLRVQKQKTKQKQASAHKNHTA